jgi:subtilisin family serine protease
VSGLSGCVPSSGVGSGVTSTLTEGAGGEVVVAVVDSGVEPRHEVFGESPVLLGTAFVPAPDGVIEEQDAGDVNGHGTAIGGIIAWHAPGARILPVRVLDAELRSRGDVLAAGIDWAVEHGADIVNVSADTDGGAHGARIFDAVERARDRDALVVASAGRFGARSMPACLDGVVSVGPAFLRDSDAWVHLPGQSPEFLAQAAMQVVAAPCGYDAVHGASFAAAHVSGIAAAMLFESGARGVDLFARLREERITNDPTDARHVFQSRMAVASAPDHEIIRRHRDVFDAVMEELARRSETPLAWDSLLGIEPVDRAELYPAILAIQRRLGTVVTPLKCAGLAIASPFAVGLLLIAARGETA